MKNKIIFIIIFSFISSICFCAEKRVKYIEIIAADLFSNKPFDITPYEFDKYRDGKDTIIIFDSKDAKRICRQIRKIKVLKKRFPNSMDTRGKIIIYREMEEEIFYFNPFYLYKGTYYYFPSSLKILIDKIFKKLNKNKPFDGNYKVYGAK